MKVLLLLFQSYLKRSVRYFYWFYRLNYVKFGKHPKLEFPIRVEGNGKILFGDNSVVQRLAFLGTGLDSKLSVGHDLFF